VPHFTVKRLEGGNLNKPLVVGGSHSSDDIQISRANGRVRPHFATYPLISA
jgi:hypothetical protein